MKKTLAVVFAAVSIFIAGNVQAANELTKISEHVYAYVDTKQANPAKSFGANTGIIIGNEYVVAVDSLISAKEGKRFLEAIAKVTPLPVKYVINTHFHLDHVFGNSEFAKQGAEIIAHHQCRLAMEKTGEATLKGAGGYGLTEEDMAGTELKLPDLTFNDALNLSIGGVSINVYKVGPAHTEGSVVVMVPEEKVIFSGDILFTNYHPYMVDGDLAGWQKSLDHLLSLDVDAIIPGHGPLSTKKDVQDMKEYLVLFDKTAKELAKGTDDYETIFAKMKETMPKRAEMEALIGANLMMRYNIKPAPPEKK